MLTGEPVSADAARALVDLALERGAPDNVTVIVAAFAVKWERLRCPVLPDVLRPSLAVVFCGTAAVAIGEGGRLLRRTRNKFWPVLARTGLTPRRSRRGGSLWCFRARHRAHRSREARLRR